MKKIIVLTMMLVFLWTGVSFAENWIMYYEGSSMMNSFFDADRVIKKGNGFDYWTRVEYSPDAQRLLGDKYRVEHMQVELREGEWWIRRLEAWSINSQGTLYDYTSGHGNWKRMETAKEPEGIALLNGLQKYAR